MLLHQRANHADHKQSPQKINMRVTTFQYKISGKNHICSVKTFSSRALSTRQKKKIHWKKQHFGRSKSRVWPTVDKVLHAKQP